MTTVTKVFVILVCLFALIFTPLAVQFAARSHNWKQVAENARDQAETAYASERVAYGVAASEVEYYADRLKAEQKNAADLQLRIATLEGDLDKLRQDRAMLASSRDSLQTTNTLLTAQLDVASKHNTSLGETKEKALARERELQTQNLQLTDRVKELSAEVAVLDQQNKQRTEELASFREENKKLREQMKLGQAGQIGSVTAPQAVAASPAAAAPGPVTGQITDVKGTLATIDAGSASGVREGMTVVVTRGGNYVCDLQITSNITPNESVGRIMYEQEGRRVRAGDKVQDASSFEARR